ncbi:TlpA family protein disulfide reductase [Pseudomonas benzopyrenica]|uniref:TlpA family protein disulfide reductase n=1 Tax=Pseudomonas benzopyrenica TaxID=2993566 RepID=UPI0039C3E637
MKTHFFTQPDIRSALRLLFRKKMAGTHARQFPSFLLLILVPLCFIATGALAETSRPTPDQVPLTTLDGQTTTLRHYQGKITVVNLWATWCAPCRKEMKVFEEAKRAYPQVAILLVNQGETAAQAKDFLSAQNLTFPDVLLDRDMAMMTAVDSIGLPTTTFYDKRGTLLETHLGEISAADLKNKLEAHLQAGDQGAK